MATESTNSVHPSHRLWSSILACLVASAILHSSVVADTVTYRLTVNNTWSERTHPGLFPPGAHFSWHGGATHNDQTSFWQVGGLASPGIVLMAETGLTTTLLQEVQARISAGLAGSVLDWPWWFCPIDTESPSCGDVVVDFEISDEHPLVTLVSMLGPSPDWFVGVAGLPLRSNEQWLEEVVVDLHPYDGGTRDANVFQLFGPLTIPPEPISLITERSGQIITPASLGTYTFTLMAAPCPADLSGDGAVGVADLLGVLAAWGRCPGCPEDLDGNGEVGVNDLLTVLNTWGPCSLSPVATNFDYAPTTLRALICSFPGPFRAINGNGAAPGVRAATQPGDSPELPPRLEPLQLQCEL